MCFGTGLGRTILGKYLVHRQNLNKKYKIGWIYNNESDLLTSYRAPAFEDVDMNLCDELINGVESHMYHRRTIYDNPLPSLQQLLSIIGLKHPDYYMSFEPDVSNYYGMNCRKETDNRGKLVYFDEYQHTEQKGDAIGPDWDADYTVLPYEYYKIDTVAIDDLMS